MNNLNEVIGEVVEKIKNFRSLYEQNEMAVRSQIVNPILRDLGWNPENPEEVQPNVSTEEGIPDYSLIKDGKKMLFVEAKKLSVDIEQKGVMRQLARYSFGEGTKYGVLTNGAVWVLIRSFEEGTTLTERIVWKADLENEESPSVIRKLITISKENVEKIEILVKKDQILNEFWQSLLKEPEEMLKGLMPLIKSTITQRYPNYRFEDTEIEGFFREKIKKISEGPSEGEDTQEGEGIPPIIGQKRMKLGSEVFEPYSKANEILVKTANWLIKKGKLKTSDCPVPAGPKRYLINTEPTHRYGDKFFAAKNLSNGLWMEVTFSASDCERKARDLSCEYPVACHRVAPAAVGIWKLIPCGLPQGSSLVKFGYPPDILVIYQ